MLSVRIKTVYTENLFSREKKNVISFPIVFLHNSFFFCDLIVAVASKNLLRAIFW